MPTKSQKLTSKTELPRLRIERLEPRFMLAVGITEFLASNENGELLDEDGDDSDWIEIYNSGPADVDLSGWHLTDDAERPSRWRFPAQVLVADEYVVVFASGKNRAMSGSQLHTNFKLDRGGEYLALVQPDGVTIATQFASSGGSYPEQRTNVSYGPTQTAAPVQSGNFFMTEPTPGATNAPGFRGFIKDTTFSVDRGLYSTDDLSTGGALARGVTISASADAPPGTYIYFSTDGSEPAPDNPHATLYTTPVPITETTTLRAAAYADQFIPSDVDTQTYIFTSDVLRQDGEGLPRLSQTDYVMDPEIVEDPRFATLEDDLKSLPTVSLVGPIEELFGRRGIIENPTRLGRAWEREVSVELIHADGSEGFQENAGLRIQGAGSRDRPFSKNGFQLFFRGEYGAKVLEFPFFGDDRPDQFDRIAFRGNFFDSWTFNQRGRVGSSCCGYDQALLLRDQFGHETHEDMGALAIAGNWVHLYINGQYWGLYNGTERPDEQFAEYYLGGDADDYDVLKQRPRGQANGSPPEVVHGDLVAWHELMTLIRGDMESDTVYRQVQQVLDVEQFADYILLNIFGGNFDWPHNNWYAIRERTENSRWTFFEWDSENFIFDVNADRTEFNTTNSPGIIYSRLRRNPEFRLLFADRVHKHMFNRGALAPDSNIERFLSIVDEIAAGMNAESARWGDTHVHPPRNTFDTWQPVVDDKVYNYFPQRTAIVLDQLRDDGLYPELDAPEFFVDGQRQHGGVIADSNPITLVQLSAAFEDMTLVDGGAPVTAYIPGADEFATPEWTETTFEPASDPLWSQAAIHGTTGVGFDTSGAYLPYVNTDVGAMQGNSGSVLMRIQFTHDDRDTFGRLQLLARYDDAFVAYLNGTEVTRTPNIRTQLPPQAARSTNHRAGEDFEVFDVSRFENLLVDGKNVLALQAINVSARSSDLLLDPRLVGGRLDINVANDSIWFTTDGSDPRDPATGLPGSAARQYSGIFTLDRGTTIKARVLKDGVWSALSEASFDAESSGDLNDDGRVDAGDIDWLAQRIRENNPQADLTQDGTVDRVDLSHFVQVTLGTTFGDSNLDGLFDSRDLVQVLQIGEYEDPFSGNSTWADGDWDGNGEFETADLVLALQADGFTATAARYEAGRVRASLAAMRSAEEDHGNRRPRELDTGDDIEANAPTFDRPLAVDVVLSKPPNTRDEVGKTSLIGQSNLREMEIALDLFGNSFGQMQDWEN